MDKDIADPELIYAEEICQQQKIDLVFRIKDIGAVHPNTYNIELKGEKGKTVCFTALSSGGGIIELTDLNGVAVSDDYEFVGPLMPVQVAVNPAMPFADINACLTLLAQNNILLSTAALEWEAALGEFTKAEVLDLSRKHLLVMKNAVVSGLAGTYYSDRILPQQSGRIKAAADAGKLIPADLTNRIIESVTAVMETKSSMGLIVASPTAGSCGTLAGTLWAVAEVCGKSDEEMVSSLLAAGLIGVFIAQQGGFAAEEGGCQYECGAASAMTAAALVEIMGGAGQVACCAASMALQNTLGLICDPVADRVEVPCLGKNIMAALNALAAANMALAGFEQVIPLDQVIAAMHEVGRNMPQRYRCTCKGGLSLTPAAQTIQQKINKKT